MPPSNGVQGPQPHTSAPVLEYICLFTYDLRRKQKRWQDGRMKFHAFNNRVVVHDDRGNSIGDAHWLEDCDPQEGDELNLDQGGVLVQVAELVARREQDLSELVDRRIQERLERHAYRDAQSRQSPYPSLTARQQPHIPPRPVHPTSYGHRPQTHAHNVQPPKHVSLNSLLGTPVGNHGRATISTESPYEIRHRDETSPSSSRRSSPPPSKAGYAHNLFGQALTLSTRPMSTAPIRRQLREPPRRHPASRQSCPMPATTRERKSESEDENDCNPHPTKRRKQEKSGYAQSLFGPPISLTVEPPSPKLVPPRQKQLPRPPAPRRHSPGHQMVAYRERPRLARSESEETGDHSTAPSHFRAHQERLSRRRQDEDNALHQARLQEAKLRRRFDDAESEREVSSELVPSDQSPNPQIQGNSRISPAAKQRTHNEPKNRKTELRIKGRKRRGLMFMNEKALRTPGRDITIPPLTRAQEHHPHETIHDMRPRSEETVTSVDASDPTRELSTEIDECTSITERFISADGSHDETDEVNHSKDCHPVRISRRDNNVSRRQNVKSAVPITNSTKRAISRDKKVPTAAETESDHDGKVQSNNPPKDMCRTGSMLLTSTPFPECNSVQRGVGRQTFNQLGMPNIATAPAGTFKLASLGRKGVRSKEVIWSPQEAELCTDDSVSRGFDDQDSGLGPGEELEQDLQTRGEAKSNTRDNVDTKAPVRKNGVDSRRGTPLLNQPLEQGCASSDVGDQYDKNARDSGRTVCTKFRKKAGPKQRLRDLHMSIRKDAPEGEENPRSSSSPEPPRSPLAAEPSIEISWSSVEAGRESGSDPNPDATTKVPVDEVPPKPRQRQKISNPATRGRKAAKKTDAAGRPPESFLPNNPIPPTPPRLKARPQLPSLSGQSRKGYLGPPANALGAPGFQRAGGGPWSREASDLLGISKPVRT
ncbi:uncharacterized protein MKZ38_004311 [Zalerion maritima]|uniref:5'-3' DNA helicase ZGRF1-like N-terminal domain-containing protein n=1 Tax=Zalerion maritima TaxID=339359 RepID=A0AAD5WQ00_9PEZI|nr:uncharacterized protein MKZ38_004311 [Zalerion maritima]